MSSMTDNIFHPLALQKKHNGDDDDGVLGLNEAMKYLLSTTSGLKRDELESLAKGFTEQEKLIPEVKFYAGWAFLDAAYPGLFSLADSPVDKNDSANSTELAKRGFDFFRQLDSRTKYLDGSLPIEVLAGKEIDLEGFIYGIRSRIIMAFEDYLTTTPEGSTPTSIANYNKKRAKHISDKLELTGKQIREQIQIAEDLINYEKSVMPKNVLSNYYDNLRGIEAECALLGAVWYQISESNNTYQDTFALPASVRTDFALSKEEPKGDVILYHNWDKFAVEIARSKISSARFNNNPKSSGNTIHFFGDRDLRLPSLQRINDKIVRSPNFKGYKSESMLVMHQLANTAQHLKSIESN